MMDLWRIRFKDGIKAADSRLVWATTKESAEALGAEYCEPRGYRFIGAECETVGREGVALEAPTLPVGVVRPIKASDTGKLPPAQLYTDAKR